MRLSCIISLAAGVLSAIASEGTAQGPNVEILAEYPPGNFLENLDVLSDGRVVFTSYFAKTIEILDNRGTASTLAHVSAHPVSILAIEGGFLVAAHGQAFTSGPAFVETQQFLLLDSGGREVAMFKAPEARFLNGMVSHSGGTILVADSVAGKIWQVDHKAHSVIPWLADGALAQDPSVKEFRPGANGLKRQGDHVLVSNSSRGTLAAIAVDSSGAPNGPLIELAKVDPIDDFVVGPTGEIIFATRRDRQTACRRWDDHNRSAVWWGWLSGRCPSQAIRWSRRSARADDRGIFRGAQRARSCVAHQLLDLQMNQVRWTCA